MMLKEAIFQDFSGAVSITKEGRTVYQRAFGYADLANKIANKIETKFATASAGKVFVAIAILQLIEQGRITFDSRIGEILAFDLKAIDPQITIRQLLNHTSGMPDYFDESEPDDYQELWKDYPNYKICTSSDIIPLFIDKPMMYTPGERFQYNNTGFVMLGLIIEAMTGDPFDVYLRDYVFIPSGMSNTGYFELDRLPAQCANAYLYDNNSKEFYINIYSVDVKGTGTGGVFTTVIDIEKFWNALMNGQLLSREMLDNMLTSQVKEECYGHGIWLDKKDDGNFAYHFEGCDPGVSFYSSYDPQQDLRMTLVSNFGSDVWELSEHIVDIIATS